MKIELHQDCKGFWRACHYNIVPAKRIFLIGTLFKFKTIKEAAFFFNKRKLFGKKLFEICAIF